MRLGRLGAIILSLLCNVAYCLAEKTNHVRELINEETQRVIAKLSYCDSDIKARILYLYNERGLTIETTVDDGISEDPASIQGVTERLITQYIYAANAIDEEYPDEVIEKLHDLKTGEVKLIKHIINTYEDGIRLVKRIVFDSLENATETTFDSAGRVLTLMEKKPNGSSQLTTFVWDPTGKLEQTTQEKFIVPSYEDASERQKILETAYLYLQQLYTHLINLVNLVSPSTQNPATEKIRHDFESMANEILGPDVFQLTGYYTAPPLHGTFGQGEIHSKVRISAANGLFNTPEDRIFFLKFVTKRHGGCNIHYVARAYQGWSESIPGAIYARFGGLSQQSFTIAATWKKLIAEMGGVHGGGTIIHYAHSIGGSETYNARTLMTPEELKMIKVYTFGSPKVIPTGEFQDAVNYCSRDSVCFIGDLYNYIKAYFDNSIKIVMLEAPLLGSHQIDTKAYADQLEQLGAQFVETYIKSSDYSPTFVID